MFTNRPGLERTERYGRRPVRASGPVVSLFYAPSRGSTQTAGGFWPNRRCPAFPPLSGVDKFQRGTMMKKKIDIAAIPELAELNIGHHLVCRALSIGLTAAVAEMRALMDRYPTPDEAA